MGKQCLYSFHQPVRRGGLCILTCCSFGAVMEEFEIRDALEAILSTKPELLGTGTG